MFYIHISLILLNIFNNIIVEDNERGDVPISLSFYKNCLYQIKLYLKKSIYNKNFEINHYSIIVI